MRKAYFLALLFACAACGDTRESGLASDDDEKAATNAVPVSTAAGGGGEAAHDGDAEESEGVDFGGLLPAGSSAGRATSSGGTTAGTTAGTATSAVGGTVAGGSSGSASLAPTDGVSVDESAPTTPPATMRPVIIPQPVPQGGQLTAGAWDDNLNFTRFKQFRGQVAQARSSGILPFTAEEIDAAHDKFSAPRAAHQQLDVALVIDTTGSMGDEISYLQREFTDLSTSIESAYPGAEQRWALVVYKDVGDLYVARQFDFRTDLNALRTDLAAQSAGGGGDFPEAPDAAFEKVNQLQWRTGAGVARLAFWIADAPHHDDKAAAMASALRTVQGQDIHVYPVASSGIDEFTELTMRSAAQLTGGRYLFLTNDSGIGGAHKEPSIPCYFVTRLDHAILRMIDIEMSGQYREPSSEQIIRTGGNPTDGACALSSGELQVF